MVKEVNIIKASGEIEPFSERKLRRSLERINTHPELITEIISHIKSELKEGMKTSEIYSHALSLLRKKEHFTAGRYSIKKALLELGPSGYPFEKMVAQILKSAGYVVEIGKIVKGYCVSHEVDVVASKDNKRLLVECKFHNRAGYKTDIKVALYINARFWDIKKHSLGKPGHRNEGNLEVWLITNTKLSSDAINYSNCVGIKAIGWNYPRDGKNLQYLLEESGLLPITCLISLTKAQKNQLLRQGLVVCREIVDQEEILQSMGISEIKRTRVLKEVGELCKYEKNSFSL
ncbi:MAG: restriction endonuclease [Dehalococcoidia bacterium]|nr:MAG: restriction endonuclease [Dehalococcoidia bacterium]